MLQVLILITTEIRIHLRHASKISTITFIMAAKDHVMIFWVQIHRLNLSMPVKCNYTHTTLPLV